MDRSKIRAFIGDYIKLRNIGTEREDLFIRYDDLIKALMQIPQFRFSATQFENMLQDEINKKILGRPLTEAGFNAICDYIWDLAVYCTSERVKDEQQTKKVLEDRAIRKRDELAKRGG